jgi:ATP-dependent RNA helicase RhlE
VSLEGLKLNKQVQSAAEELGILSPKEIQLKTVSRIIGGQDIIAVGPEGSGKSTSLIMAVLMKLKYAQDPPRTLILAPTKEKVLVLEEQFNQLGKNTDLRTIGLVAGAGIEGQKDALAEGVDIIIGTPDRIQALYLKSGINLNKLKLFVLDDAESIVKQGFHSLVVEIADRLPKCQHVVFSEVMHGKLEKLTSHFMYQPIMIEVTELAQEKTEIIPNQYFHVPNFKTKMNLLNFLLKEKEKFNKVLVLVNTKQTEETLYKSLVRFNDAEVRILGSASSEYLGVSEIQQFKESEGLQILLALNDDIPKEEISSIPFILHFDLPNNSNTFIDRVRINDDQTNASSSSIVFVTDLELTEISKIEKSIGQKMNLTPLPSDLVIEKDKAINKEEDKEEEKEVTGGGAFHEKKASNAKDYNWKYKDRLKMFGKKNRKNKRGL